MLGDNIKTKEKCMKTLYESDGDHDQSHFKLAAILLYEI
jgi:hypothetical protein